MEDDLEPEEFDAAATRPPLTFGLPHTLSLSLIAAFLLFFLLYETGDQIQDAIGDIVAGGTICMVWSAARIMLRSDFHGWDNFLAWLRLDARCLDTREWGGTHLSTLPLRSIYRTGSGEC